MHRGQARLLGCLGKGSGAPRSPLVFSGDQCQALAPLGDEELRHGTANIKVRETHQHVDGRGGQIPGFHHRNARGHQARAPLACTHDAGEKNAIGPPADDGLQQQLLPVGGVARLPQHQLVARIKQGAVERLDGFHKDRHHRAGHHRRNQPAARRRQPARHAVGHIAGALHGVEHTLAHLGRDLVGGVHHPRCRDGRHTCEFGHITQGDRTTAAARAPGVVFFSHQWFKMVPVPYTSHKPARPGEGCARSARS